MKTLFKITIAALLLPLLLPTPGFAMAPHGGVYSAKYVDGDNVVLISDNVPEAQAGIAVTYNLRLYDREGVPIPFTNVLTTFKQDTKVTDEQRLRVSSNGDTSLVYTYPQQGTYNLTAAFLDHDKQVAKAEFPIVAAKAPASGPFADLFTVSAGVAFLLGIGVSQLYVLRKQLKLPAFKSAKKTSPRKK